MPLFGQLELASIAPRLPTLPNLDTRAWALPGAETMQVLLETSRTAADPLLPKAMHPAVPSYLAFSFLRCPESPVGPFTLATVRLGSRAGAHPRGLVLGAYASTPEAADGLRRGWGIPAQAATVRLRRHHDRIIGEVVRDGTTVLDCALVNPEAISGSDVQLINWVTMANAPLDGTTAPLLIQVDPKYTFHKAERGRPEVRVFDAAAWNAGPLRPTNPIVATIAAVDTDLPRIRFVMDPVKPVYQGTRRIRESRTDE
jgi:hypothetical protein